MNMFKKISPMPFVKKSFSTSNNLQANHSCKILVVGGGTGGCSTAAKLCKTHRKNEVIILEPNEFHYYQPMFTLIGGGTYSLPNARKKMQEVLPKSATWIKDSLVKFNPCSNSVQTRNGDTITYDYMVVATGLETNYDKIPGLVEGLQTPEVCSNYSDKYVEKTYKALQLLENGNAIFTFPNSPVKCPGAPQKICYITDHYLRKKGKRDQVTIIYNTSLPVIFGVKVYADALWNVAGKRNIEVNVRTNLVEVRPDKKEAVFENLDKPGSKNILEYSMLHVTPPMSTPAPVRNSKELSNSAGFVDVNKDTMQSVRFENIFALGDCSSSPNSKTAAAAAVQCKVVYENLTSLMNGKSLGATYNGYASCPLVTGYDKCILAEFDYDLKPLETFPFRQDRELYSMYLLKKYLMPNLYWNLYLKGLWNGPETMRKILHLGFDK